MFAAAAQAAERGDWAGCRERFDAFDQALKHHMAIEERVLFPAFEQAIGLSEGPTRVMRHEHQQMLEQLDRLSVALAARDAPGFSSSAKSFAGLMAAHSAKEENVLYPMCDEVLPGLCGEKLRETISQR